MTLKKLYDNNKDEILTWGLSRFDNAIKNIIFEHLCRHRVFNEQLIAPTSWTKTWKNVIAFIEHQQYKLEQQLKLLEVDGGIDIMSTNVSINVVTDTHNKVQSDIYEPMPNINSQSFTKDTVSPLDAFIRTVQLDNILNFEEVYNYVRDQLAWRKNDYVVCSLEYNYINDFWIVFPRSFYYALQNGLEITYGEFGSFDYDNTAMLALGTSRTIYEDESIDKIFFKNKTTEFSVDKDAKIEIATYRTI